AIAVERADRATRLIDRDGAVIDAQTVALRIAIRKQTALQHFVGREADAFYNVGGVKGGLLYFSKVVIRIAVQLEIPDIDQRVLPFRPYFGKVEWVVVVVSGLLFGHDLYFHFPAGKIAFFDAVKQIALGAFAIVGYRFCRFFVGHVLNSLLTYEVEFYPGTLVGRIVHAEGVTSEAMHMTHRARNAALAHDDGDLVQCLRKGSPEVPVVLGTSQIGAGVAFNGVVQVGEAQGIFKKE